MQLLSSGGASYSEGDSQWRGEQDAEGWVVHLISMHNPDVLTQAELSAGPRGGRFCLHRGTS